MPPKTKYSLEDIEDAALAIAEREGLSGVTIRAVADALGCSIAPIYVNFETVDDLKAAVMHRIAVIGQELIAEVASGHPFKDIGVASVRFARRYPVLFKEAILQQTQSMSAYSDEADQGLLTLMAQDPELEGLSPQDLKDLLLQMRAFHTGLGLLIAGGHLGEPLTEEDQVSLLSEAAEALVEKKKRKE